MKFIYCFHALLDVIVPLDPTTEVVDGIGPMVVGGPVPIVNKGVVNSRSFLMVVPSSISVVVDCVGYVVVLSVFLRLVFGELPAVSRPAV